MVTVGEHIGKGKEGSEGRREIERGRDKGIRNK